MPCNDGGPANEYYPEARKIKSEHHTVVELLLEEMLEGGSLDHFDLETYRERYKKEAKFFKAKMKELDKKYGNC